MSDSSFSSDFGVLRQFMRKSRPAEHCELCGVGLPTDHLHLMGLKSRILLCACNACALLLSQPGNGKYKRVPKRIRFLPEFCLTAAQWESLMIPINMAFFFEDSVNRRVVAAYPSPAGATESQLSLETWGEIAEENPILNEMEPDVEALLVNRLGPTHGYSSPEYYMLPIDECYKLVGLIRTYWRGLSGGAEMWEELERYFAMLKGLSEEAGGVGHA